MNQIDGFSGKKERHYFTEEQSLMIEMSLVDVEQKKLISNEEQNKNDLEWLNSL